MFMITKITNKICLVPFIRIWNFKVYLWCLTQSPHFVFYCYCIPFCPHKVIFRKAWEEISEVNKICNGFIIGGSNILQCAWICYPKDQYQWIRKNALKFHQHDKGMHIVQTTSIILHCSSTSSFSQCSRQSSSSHSKSAQIIYWTF